jgi:RND family efflux transporter MFP subunit
MNVQSWKARLPLMLLPALALAAAVSLPGCNNGPAQATGEKERLKVDASLPIVKDVTEYEDFTGRVEAANKVAIQAMVTGYLIKQNFVDGDDVKKGQVLFEIDPKIYFSKHELAKAMLVQAQAHFERLDGDYTRGQALVGASKAMSPEEFQKIKGDRLEAHAAVGQAQAQLKQAKDNLDYTTVVCPFEGKVSRRMIDVGNMVKANETMLTFVYAIDPMYGYFDVDERSVIRIRKLINSGQMSSYHEGKIVVEVGLADEEDFSLKGTIDWVDQVLDAGTGTLKMRCVIPQPRKQVVVTEALPPLSVGLFVSAQWPTVEKTVDQPQVLVSPGMFVRVRLPVGTPQKAFLIAERAVGTEQGKKYVNIVDSSGKVDRRYVELGQMHFGLRVVMSSPGQKPLDKNDKIIVNNLQRVGPGKEVDARLVSMPQYIEPAPAAVGGAPQAGNGNKAG